MWRAADPEPPAWDVRFTDGTGVLPGIAGDHAGDSWSSIAAATPGSPTPQDTFIDDVRVTRICGP